MVTATALSSFAVAALLLAIALHLYQSLPRTTPAHASAPPQATKQQEPVLEAPPARTTISPAQDTTAPPKTSTAGVPLPPAEKSNSAEMPPYPRYENVTDRSKARIFSVEELADHKGDDRSKPLLLAILGDVFDVGPGERFYAPNQGYAQMGGSDASRSFVDLTENGQTSSLVDLPSSEIAEVMRWRNEFYRPHKEYNFVGLVNDRYYNDKGERTIELMKLERMQKGSANADEERKKLEKRFMSCNSKHESGKPNLQLWCDDSYHAKGSRPVHMYFHLPAAVDGEEQEKGNRCACVVPADREAADAEAKGEQGKAQTEATTFKFVDYVDCQTPDSQRCARPKGSTPPPEDR